MSVYSLAFRISSVESSVDDLQNKVDSVNADLIGTTS